jgi:hypothetical protein
VRDYAELKALIEKRGVHAEFGDAGEGWGIEQNPHELATFLVRMQELGVQSVLEIGTGYKGGLSRFLAADMGWDVTTVDVKNYGHVFEGVHYIIGKNAWFDRRFDLVFIDGDHQYQSVHHDYRFYAPLATKAVGFHDMGGKRGCHGVLQFWLDMVIKPEGDMRSMPGYYQIWNHNDPQSAGIAYVNLSEINLPDMKVDNRVVVANEFAKKYGIVP